MDKDALPFIESPNKKPFSTPIPLPHIKLDPTPVSFTQSEMITIKLAEKPKKKTKIPKRKKMPIKPVLPPSDDLELSEVSSVESNPLTPSVMADLYDTDSEQVISCFY
jgi:hypothetical protein